MTGDGISKIIAFVPISEETLADGRGFLDRLQVGLAADAASEGERYRGVYARGYAAGAAAAFDALREFIDKGGRVGLPLGPDSLHMLSASGLSTEIMSLLALRPFTVTG